MTVQIKVPAVGESIAEVVIGEWLRTPGTWVAQDEPVVSLETDKVNGEVPAPAAGILGQPLRQKGETALIGDVLGTLEESAEPPVQEHPPAASPLPQGPTPPAPAQTGPAQSNTPELLVMPAARRILAQAGLPAAAADPTGPGGRLLKEDALRAVTKGQGAAATPGAAAPLPGTLRAGTTIPLVYAAPLPEPQTEPTPPPAHALSRREEVVPMTPLRRRVAERLVAAQQTAAILTTFNEVDMSAISDLRRRHQEAFTLRHGIKLGFMGFFVQAAVAALRQFPGVNAQIRGDNIVYQHFYDIGVAIGGGKGLVVPVLRDADTLSLAQVEKTLADFAAKAKAGKLALADLAGGTFSISNGGVYGSMLSTPILNPPQSAILGMHNIIERPVGVAGQVVLRPMMYLALSYDHRLIDGREAVSFLVKLRQLLEAPERLLLDI